MGSGSGETNFGVERATVVAIALGVNTPRPSIHVPISVPVAMAMAMAMMMTAMIAGSVHREINQPICGIPPFGTLVPDPFKMWLDFYRFARVHHLSLGEEDETVKEIDNVGLGLVDGKDDGAFVPLGECVQRLNDVLRIVRVESRGGFVEEQDGRSGHELARDGHPAFLAA